jgi:RimJ/RimL family protein N-acetyltransferase
MSPSLRPAAIEDCEIIFRWRNDPFIVARGSTRKTVSWEEHSVWFRDSLAMPERRALWVVEEDGEPIGLVRFDRDAPTAATIGVYLVQERTGRGSGVSAIRRGCEEIRKRWPVNEITACVRADNSAAMKAFVKAGFERAIIAAPCPECHHRFTLTCP